MNFKIGPILYIWGRDYTLIDEIPTLATHVALSASNAHMNGSMLD
jgi:hypothetical protein